MRQAEQGAGSVGLPQAASRRPGGLPSPPPPHAPQLNQGQTPHAALGRSPERCQLPPCQLAG